MRYPDKTEFDKANSFGLGNPNEAYAQYFDGQSYLNALTEFGKAVLYQTPSELSECSDGVW